MSALGIAGTIAYNTDPIEDRTPVVAKDPQTVALIQRAALTPDPVKHLQDSLGLTQDQLIERVKTWIPSYLLPQ